MTKRKADGPDRVLAACTKEDLIWLIKHMCAHERNHIMLSRALDDLRYAKELARIDQADAQMKKADAARRRYVEILKPYDGMRFIDIPMEVLEAADRAMKEAQAADRKWERLMMGGG